MSKHNLKLGELVEAKKECPVCLAENGWCHLYKECLDINQESDTFQCDKCGEVMPQKEKKNHVCCEMKSITKVLDISDYM